MEPELPKLRGWCRGWCKHKKPRQISYLTIHHIDPLRHGGPNVRSNTIALCQRCHDYYEMILGELDESAHWQRYFIQTALKDLPRDEKAARMEQIRVELFKKKPSILRKRQRRRLLAKAAVA